MRGKVYGRDEKRSSQTRGNLKCGMCVWKHPVVTKISLVCSRQGPGKIERRTVEKGEHIL